MAYGSVLTDVVQSSVTGTPPQFNDGNGTQTGTLCRAWVKFVTAGTISASFNVSSITKNSTGNWSVTFTTALADANYSAISLGSQSATATGDYITGQNTFASGSYKITSCDRAGNPADSAVICSSVFR